MALSLFTINTIADAGKGAYCFCNRTPEGIDIRSYRLSRGEEFGADYPADTDQVRLRLGADYPGLKLPSFIGNTGGFLAVDRQTADIVLAHSVGHIERLPFLLLDHKGRVHSRDYVFLNPLEHIDCLNLDLSVVRRDEEDGEIMAIKKLVVARVAAPRFDLSRLGERSRIYLFSGKLVGALQDAGCTNFFFSPVEIH